MGKNKNNKDITEENINEENLNDNAEKVTEESPEEKAAKAAAEAAEAAEESTKNSRDELAELKDKYLRQVAEFDNFRKRTEREKTAMFDMGAMAILNRFLPTIDNFERGLDKADDSAFAEGMKMVYKDFMKNLEDAGVKAIEAKGQKFDPNLHNAVMHEEDDSGEENVVSEELQKGYLYKDNVLRHSMVKVLN